MVTTKSADGFEAHCGFSALAYLFDGLIALQEGARNRRELATLDERVLRDIGLSRSMIEAELTKTYWDH